MAHNVQIEKFQRYAKDGHPLKGKYRYKVSCKRCGDLNQGPEILTEAGASLCKSGHHDDMHQQHSAKNPHDTRHKSAPTKKRVQTKMVKLRG